MKEPDIHQGEVDTKTTMATSMATTRAMSGKILTGEANSPAALEEIIKME